MSSQWQLDSLSEAELMDLAGTAFATLRTRSFDHLDNTARLDLVDEFEHLTRTIPGITHELINQLGNQNAADELNATHLAALLAARLHITAHQASRRIADAAALGPGTTLGGQPLAAPHAQTGQAQRDGDINTDHADVILKFFRRLPDYVSAQDREWAEGQLVDLAKQADANAVQAAAEQIEAHLNPDGSLDDEKDRTAQTYFRMKPQSRDKLTRGSFCIDAETRAFLEAYFAKAAKRSSSVCEDEPTLFDPPAPAQPQTPQSEQREQDLRGYFAQSREPSDNPPAAPTPPTPSAPSAAPAASATADAADATDAEPEAQPAEPGLALSDARSLGQRQHDALKELLRSILGNPDLGQHRGLPVTAIITMSLRELETATGNAYSGGGTLIPMCEAIRMATAAHHYLMIYDGDTGRPLHLGRAKRLASADQRLVLHGTDRGCTYPECPRPGYQAQTHHVIEWADGGCTDIEVLTFGCDQHHTLVGAGENDWATTVSGPHSPYPGRTLWHPPACVDPQRRGRVNHHHHPGEYLRPPVQLPTLREQRHEQRHEQSRE